MSATSVRVQPEHGLTAVPYNKPTMTRDMVKTASGVQLMPGEHEMFVGAMKPKLEPESTCCDCLPRACLDCCSTCSACCCECYKPMGEKRMDIVIPNKRIIIRHYMAAQYPGAKTCTFWVWCAICPCCCISNLCCGHQERVLKETEDAFYITDLRDAHFDFGCHTVETDTCCGDPSMVDKDTSGLPLWSTVMLEFSKPVGVSKAKSETVGNIGSWKIDKQMATYNAKIVLQGFIVDEEMRDLQFMVKNVLHDNMTAGKPSVEASLAVPHNVNISMGNADDKSIDVSGVKTPDLAALQKFAQ